MRTEAETGVMQLRAKGCQGLPATTRSWGNMELIPL